MRKYTALSSLGDRAYKSSALPFYRLWNKREKRRETFSTSQEGNNGGNRIQEKYTHRRIFQREQHRGIYLGFLLFCCLLWGFF